MLCSLQAGEVAWDAAHISCSMPQAMLRTRTLVLVWSVAHANLVLYSIQRSLLTALCGAVVGVRFHLARFLDARNSI